MLCMFTSLCNTLSDDFSSLCQSSASREQQECAAELVKDLFCYTAGGFMQPSDHSCSLQTTRSRESQEQVGVCAALRKALQVSAKYAGYQYYMHLRTTSTDSSCRALILSHLQCLRNNLQCTVGGAQLSVVKPHQRFSQPLPFSVLRFLRPRSLDAMLSYWPRTASKSALARRGARSLSLRKVL